MEKEYSTIETLDFSQLSCAEIAKHIQDFVLKGSEILRDFLEQSDYGNYFPMFEMYRKGLVKLLDTLKQLCDKSNKLGVDYYIVEDLLIFIGNQIQFF